MADQNLDDKYGDELNRINAEAEDDEQEDLPGDNDVPAMSSSKIYYYTTLPADLSMSEADDAGEVYEEGEDGIMYIPKTPAISIQQNNVNARV